LTKSPHFPSSLYDEGQPRHFRGSTEHFRPNILLGAVTATSHRVQFYEASCHHCRRTFSIPLLGDQTYGQFIFHGEKGSVFGYLSASEEPAWEDITERLERAGLLTTPRSRPDIEHLQRVIAASADPINGETLLLYPICPGCRSRSVEYGDSRPSDTREIPGVTFRDYHALSEQNRTESLRQLWAAPRLEF
jgi:hypothetical protein